MVQSRKRKAPEIVDCLRSIVSAQLEASRIYGQEEGAILLDSIEIDILNAVIDRLDNEAMTQQAKPGQVDWSIDWESCVGVRPIAIFYRSGEDDDFTRALSFNPGLTPSAMKVAETDLARMLTPPKLIPYNSEQAFEKLKIGTPLVGKIDTTHQGRRSPVKKFTCDESGWCILLDDGGQFTKDGALTFLTHEDGSPCGVMES